MVSSSRVFTAACLFCSAVLHISGFVGQEAVRQGQKQPAQMAREHNLKEALEKEKETGGVYRAARAHMLSRLNLGMSQSAAEPSDSVSYKSESVTAFLMPSHNMPRSVHRRAAALQLPETHFVMAEAKHCIEDGCDITWAEELLQRLKHDEKKIRLQCMQRGAGLTWLRKLLHKVHDVRRSLMEVMSMLLPQSSFIAFGSGDTGGVLKQHKMHDEGIAFGSGETAGVLMQHKHSMQSKLHAEDNM